jgi:predicted permease
VLGVLVARVSILTLRDLRPERLRLLDGMALNGRVLAFAAAAALLATLLFGALPALRTGRGWVAGLLRGSRGGVPSGARARRALVIVEVALSFTLLVAAVQVARTLVEAARRDPGFDHESLLAVSYRLPAWRFPEEADRAAANEAIQERVRALPGVASAARGAVPPGTGIFFGQAELEGGSEPETDAGNEVFFGSSISEGWLETLGVPVLEGRTVSAADERSDESLWLLGEGLAERLLPGGDVVGRRFRVGGEWGRVIAVVGEVLASASLGGPAYEQIWLVGGPATGGSLAVRTRGEPAAAAPAIRAAIRSVDPQIPVTEIETVKDRLRAALARERLTAALLTAFAATAGLLTVVGLYGVLSQIVRVRLHEYGIRLSLGAAPGRLFVAIVRGGALTVAGGILLGIATATAGLRLLGSRLSGLEGADPASFTAAAVLLVVVSVLASALPARRAARADPVEVLRSE